MQGGGVDPKTPAQRQPATAPAAADASGAAATAPTEVAGVEKSNLTRIAPDLTTETLWSSKEENLFSLAVVDGVPYVGTDLRGRVYSIAPMLQGALVAETGEGEVTRLLGGAGALTVATGTQAKLYTLTSARESAGASGSYESPVHDAGAVARWGRVEWRGDLQGGRVLVSTRSGNSPRPDKTWSEWSTPLSDPLAAKVTSPNARYIQWRAELKGSADQWRAELNGSASHDAALSIDSLSVSYQPQNNAPAVHSITVTPQWAALAQRTPNAGQTAGPATFSVTVSDSGDSGPATSAGTPVQQINRTGQLQLQISWQADDPDNDRLLHAAIARRRREYLEDAEAGAERQLLRARRRLARRRALSLPRDRQRPAVESALARARGGAG